MISMRAKHWVGRLSMWVVLGAALTGCSSFHSPDLYWGSRMGLRPDEPVISATAMAAAPCKEYASFTTYALNLKEAYRTRTTQNRMWLYVAGITGLGVAAASGALAAATAVAAGTLALLAISGGFTAATFATIDNTELSNVYTLSANEIGTALALAEAQVIRDPSDCADALATLVTAVSDARNTLETARTNSAAGALIRAQAGLKTIQALNANPKAALDSDLLVARSVDPTQTSPVKGAITQIATVPPTVPAPSAATPIPIPPAGQRIAVTVENVQFDKVAPEDIKLVMDTRLVSIDDVTKNGEFKYEVRVQIKQPPPDPAKRDYEPYLVVGKSKARIPNNLKLVLHYQ